jgi:hypothetical protein
MRDYLRIFLLRSQGFPDLVILEGSVIYELGRAQMNRLA